MENISLEKDILTTLLYADVFDMPLTAFEVWRYLMHTGGTGNDGGVESEIVSLFVVSEALAVLTLKNRVVRQSGMFTLPKREYLVTERILRMKRSDRKWKKFLRVARWMRLCPFVRMIGVTGRLATKQTEVKSDWDVLIVMEYRHIWTGRFLLTLILHLMGKRRWGNHTQNRVCLNHFLTTQSLEIFPKDLFSAREYAVMVPVFGWKMFQTFEKENKWIQKYLSHWEVQETPPLHMLSSSRGAMRAQRAGEYFFGGIWWEKWAQRLQKQKIENNPKTHLPNAHIIANDNSLIFLPNPQGPRVFEEFMERMGKTGL